MAFFYVGHRKVSGSDLQNAKPRRPARVNISRIGMPQPLWLRKRPGNRLSGFKVGHGDSKIRISDGFLEISGLSIYLALPFSGVVINTHVKLSDTYVVSPDSMY